MLPPGRWMRVDSAGNHEAGQYWNLWNASEDVPIKPGENGTQDLLLDLLEESMELHLVSDVPVGLFLSGGIDSSALVSLMERLGRTPRTFNVSFKESAFDEGKYARLVADRFQTDHTEITLHEQDLLDQLPEALASMDRPTGDGLNTYVISRAVRQEGLKVALSGLGGDELFGGYPSFKRLYRWRRLLETWGRMPGGIRRKLADVVQRFSGMSSRGTKLAELIAGDGSLARSFPVFRQVLSPRQWKGLLDSSWLKNAGSWEDPCVELLSETFGERVKEGRFLRAVSFAEMRTYMHDVLLTDTDQMSMAHSLEIRVPLLDHKLVEFVTALPDSRKPVHGTPKQLLVETLRPSLPDAVVDRPKQGFVLPMNRWMQEGLRAFCQKHLQSDRLGARAFMDAGALESLWERYLSHPDRVQWSRIWTLVVLENWLERHDIIV